ncbi:Gfo/Idh/MocA family protein [Portibacter marinus]|uniref:Gfo/Idh/MocA family protein n=1 Tax=Portibacter marinus TaxID=2898660 RepID=UPI001F4814E6|nr:Gfo/Idh/MocA family oxidoreductase [Portibacter marinus]
MLKGACIGAGYFSTFHFDAWKRIEGIEIVAICDKNLERAENVAGQFGFKNAYADVQTMFEKEEIDFVDIITPPETHHELIQAAINAGIDIICQKPLATDFKNAEKIAGLVAQSKVRFMVHENWRWQPWYREIRKLLVEEEIIAIHHRMRMGDGWQVDAYLNRQPYFRKMDRLLIHETGIHFIDTFRFLAGEIKNVQATFRRLNKNIKGEDFAWVQFEFESGALGFYDANRYNESRARNPRLTFGEMLVETRSGSIRLYEDGRLTVQKLGQGELEHQYHFEDRGFAGDSVLFTQQHFIDGLKNNAEFETNLPDYMKSLKVEEEIYQSAAR